MSKGEDGSGRQEEKKDAMHEGSVRVALPLDPGGPGSPMPGSPGSPFDPGKPGKPGCPG